MAAGSGARGRLAGLTVRAAAAEARVSSGLVFFQFGDRDELLVALLEGPTPEERILSAIRHAVKLHRVRHRSGDRALKSAGGTHHLPFFFAR